jgi:hypothetical protein
MINAASVRFPLEACAWILAGAIGGAAAGIATAQDRPPGQLDATCASQCLENGNEAVFCEQVCWVPDPEVAARSQPVHWPCFASCRERGGKPEECLPSCRQR